MIRRTCLLLSCLLALVLFAGPPAARANENRCKLPPLTTSLDGADLSGGDSPAGLPGIGPGAGSGKERPLPSTFVTVNNGRFWFEGKPFRHVGVNGGFYQGVDIWNDTYFMRQGGVRQLRIILPNSYYRNPQDVILRLNQALDAAWDRGILITVVLTDFYRGRQYGSDGHMGYDVVPGDEAAYNVPYGDDICLLGYEWINGGFRTYYKEFVKTIVRSFKDDARIFAWEIGNEIKAPDRPNGQAAVEETIAFYREMAQTIRDEDGHHHLVAPGIICTEWFPLSGAQKTQLYEVMDYVTEHHYKPKTNSGSLDDSTLAWAFNKPLVIEEFGVSQGEDHEPYHSDHDLIMPTVSDFFDWAYAEEPSKTADSVMSWGVDFGNDLGANDGWYGPTAQNLASQYLQLWRESADWLRPSPRYSDVPPGSTFYDYIECLSNRRALSGRYEWVDDDHNDEFRPVQPITRAEAVKAIVRGMGFDLSFPSTASFSDVPRSSPYFRYVETAKALEIINGYSDGTFHPDAHLTRGQMAKVIIRAGMVKYGWRLEPSGGPHFIDVPVGHTFYEYVEEAWDRGIIIGYGNYYYPGNETTRGQFAKMLAVASSCYATTD